MPFDEQTPEVEATDEEWNLDDLLPDDDDPVVEEAEHKLDDVIQKQSKAIRRVAERQAEAERKTEVERLTTEAYKDATETEKELFDIYVAGLSEPSKVKRAIDAAKAKAAKIDGKPEPESDAESEDTTEAEAAFAPPVGNAPPRVEDKGAQLTERTRKGDTRAALQEFILYGGGLPKKG